MQVTSRYKVQVDYGDNGDTCHEWKFKWEVTSEANVVNQNQKWSPLPQSTSKLRIYEQGSTCMSLQSIKPYCGLKFEWEVTSEANVVNWNQKQSPLPESTSELRIYEQGSTCVSDNESWQFIAFAVSVFSARLGRLHNHSTQILLEARIFWPDTNLLASSGTMDS